MRFRKDWFCYKRKKKVVKSVIKNNEVNFNLFLRKIIKTTMLIILKNLFS